MPTDQAQILAKLEEIGRAWRERDQWIAAGAAAGITGYRMAKVLGMSPQAVQAIVRKTKETQS